MRSRTCVAPGAGQLHYNAGYHRRSHKHPFLVVFAGQRCMMFQVKAEKVADSHRSGAVRPFGCSPRALKIVRLGAFRRFCAAPHSPLGVGVHALGYCLHGGAMPVILYGACFTSLGRRYMVALVAQPGN